MRYERSSQRIEFRASFLRLAVRSYLSTGSVAEPLTIIEGVAAIPPGCVVEVTQRRRLVLAWNGRRNLPTLFSRRSQEKSAPPVARTSHPQRPERIRSLSPRQRRPRRRIPFGRYRLDGSGRVGKRSSATPIESFTVVFEEADFSEAGVARDSAERFGTHHHEIMFPGAISECAAGRFHFDGPAVARRTQHVRRQPRRAGRSDSRSYSRGSAAMSCSADIRHFHRAETVAPLFKLPGAIRRFGAMGAGSVDDMRAARVETLLRDSSPSHAAYLASRTCSAIRSSRA